MLFFTNKAVGCTTNADCDWCTSGATCVGYSERKIGEDCRSCDCASQSNLCIYSTACTCMSYMVPYCPTTCSCTPCTPIYEIVPGRCYYDEDCYSSNECNLWSGWSSCNASGEQYHTCIDGPYLIEWQDCGSNPTSQPSPTPTPSCSVSLPENQSVTLDQNISLRASITSHVGTITRVDFSSSGSAISTPSPVSDSTSTYDTSVTGLSTIPINSGTVTANVIMGGSSRCSDTTTVTVTEPGAWWQLKDSDVFSSGNITSLISSICTAPCQNFFNLDGDGGFPGIPIYSGSLTIGSYGNISSTNWKANTDTILKKTYSLSYFLNQIPQDVIITQISESSVGADYFNQQPNGGTYWYKYDSSQGEELTINSDLTIGSRKVILILDGVNLFINGKINLLDGNGMFLVLAGKNSSGVRGNIYINPSVGGTYDSSYEIEGLFLTENRFYTGEGTIPLQIRGSIAALGGIHLQRNLADNTQTPSEFIQFAPDQILLMPLVVKNHNIIWKEVAP